MCALHIVPGPDDPPRCRCTRTATPSIAAFTALIDQVFTPYQQASYCGVLFTAPLVFQIRPESIYDRKKIGQGYRIPWTISLTPGALTKHLILTTPGGSLPATHVRDVLVDLPALTDACEVRFTTVNNQSAIQVRADVCLATALHPERRLRAAIESLIVVGFMTHAAALPYWPVGACSY